MTTNIGGTPGTGGAHGGSDVGHSPSMPKAAIIIPVYNGAAYIARAIASILNQTEPSLELFVVDDGSTDATREIVTSVSDPRLTLIAQANAGPSAARNAGIAASTAPWVGFLDADDWWLPEKLAAHLRLAEQRPDLGLIHSSVIVFDEDEKFVDVLVASADGAVLEPLLFGNIIVGGGSSVTVRRDVLDEVGWFDPTVKFGEDWELWLRIAARHTFAAIPEALTCRMQREAGYGANPVTMRDECVRFLNRAFDTFAAPLNARRGKALAEVYYRAASALHDNKLRGAACYDLFRTLARNPLHGYAYRRLVRLAISV